VTEGWFDASGLGLLSRGGQIFSDTPYGGLLGTFTGDINDGSSIGDIASFMAMPAHIGGELMLGLNMSESDQGIMNGQIIAHVLRIRDPALASVAEGEVPGRYAIVAVDQGGNKSAQSGALGEFAKMDLV